MTTPQKGNSGVSAKGSPAPKSGQAMTKATRTMRVRPTDHAAPNNAIITHRARAAAQRKAQRKMLQESAQSGGRASKKLGSAAVQAVKEIGKGVASAVSSILSAGGGAVVLVLLLTVILVAAIVASPFGILFSNESREAGVVPISAAVAQVNYEFNERLEALQTADDYDSISVTGQPADWVEVLAVFAVKVAGSNDADAADVATMDADRIARLKAVFWDMTAIKTEVETINHPGSGDRRRLDGEKPLYHHYRKNGRGDENRVSLQPQSDRGAGRAAGAAGPPAGADRGCVLRQRGHGGAAPQSAGRSVAGARSGGTRRLFSCRQGELFLGRQEPS